MPNSEDYKPILCGAYLVDGTGEGDDGVFVEILLTNDRRIIVERTVKNTYSVRVVDLAGTMVEGPIEACQNDFDWDKWRY